MTKNIELDNKTFDFSLFSLEGFMKFLELLITENLTSKKLAALIRNFEDFKKGGWTGLYQKEGPKTINQIRKDWQ